MGAGKGGPTGVVNWSTARRMTYAWCLTLPLAAVLGGLGALLADQGNWGVVLLGLIGASGAGWIYLINRRRPVQAHDTVNTVAEPVTAIPVTPTAAADVVAA